MTGRVKQSHIAQSRLCETDFHFCQQSGLSFIPEKEPAMKVLSDRSDMIFPISVTPIYNYIYLSKTIGEHCFVLRDYTFKKTFPSFLLNFKYARTSLRYDILLKKSKFSEAMYFTVLNLVLPIIFCPDVAFSNILPQFCNNFLTKVKSS